MKWPEKSGNKILLERESNNEKRRYTAEFKKEAAKMIIIDGTSVQEVSEQLGVSIGVLYSWKQQHLQELEANSKLQGQSPKAMVDEIGQLRKQLAKQKHINEQQQGVYWQFNITKARIRIKSFYPNIIS